MSQKQNTNKSGTSTSNTSKSNTKKSQKRVPAWKTPLMVFAGGVVLIVASFSILAARVGQTPNGATPIDKSQVFFSSPHSYSKPVKETKEVKLDEPVADFEMVDIDGKRHKLSDWKGQMPLIFFADLSCPCVQAYNGRMEDLQKKYHAQGLRIAYIFPAPKDDVSSIQKLVKSVEYPWPSIRDADQSIMKRFNAQCTTEAFLLDRQGRLRYHGRVDESTFEPEKAKSHDLDNAINALLEDKPVPVTETAAYACTIPLLAPVKTKTSVQKPVTTKKS